MICYPELRSYYLSFFIKIPIGLTDYLLRAWVISAVTLFNQLPETFSDLHTKIVSQ